MKNNRNIKDVVFTTVIMLLSTIVIIYSSSIISDKYIKKQEIKIENEKTYGSQVQEELIEIKKVGE